MLWKSMCCVCLLEYAASSCFVSLKARNASQREAGAVDFSVCARTTNQKFPLRWQKSLSQKMLDFMLVCLLQKTQRGYCRSWYASWYADWIIKLAKSSGTIYGKVWWLENFEKTQTFEERRTKLKLMTMSISRERHIIFCSLFEYSKPNFAKMKIRAHLKQLEQF